MLEYVSSVLRRASDVIDLLGANPAATFGVHEVARAVGLPPASCHRILRELVDLGWADQPGPRKAYRIGPRVWAMTRARGYRPGLMARVRDPARRLAERIGRPVLIAVLRGTVRQTLWEYRPDGVADPARQFRESPDLYRTSGGRLLLALADRRRRDAIVDAYGLPDPQAWPGIVSRGELEHELAAIRRRGWERIERPRMVTMSAAFPDFESAPGRKQPPWAAIGSYGPRRGWNEDGAAAIRDAARELS